MDRYSAAGYGPPPAAGPPGQTRPQPLAARFIASTYAYVSLTASAVALAVWSPALVGTFISPVLMAALGWWVVWFSSARDTALGRRTHGRSRARLLVNSAVGVVTAEGIGVSFVAAAAGRPEYCSARMAPALGASRPRGEAAASIPGR